MDLVLILGFVALVGFVSWRFRHSSAAPRSCCSAKPWPPDDLSGGRTRDRS